MGHYYRCINPVCILYFLIDNNFGMIVKLPFANALTIKRYFRVGNHPYDSVGDKSVYLDYDFFNG